jgi:hypothetical protein
MLFAFRRDFKLKGVELAVFAGMDPIRRHPREGRVVLAILVVLLLGGGADGQQENQGANQDDRVSFHYISPLFMNALRLSASPATTCRVEIHPAAADERKHRIRTGPTDVKGAWGDIAFSGTGMHGRDG